MIAACREVGPALFFTLLIITVSFLPVFTLEAQEGRLFAPLAYTKTFAMAGAALLSVTLVPVLMLLFIRGQHHAGGEEPGESLPDLDLPPGHRLGDALEEAHHRCSPLVALAVSAYPAMQLAPSSCRRSTKARCSTCRPRCPACR